MGTEKAKQMLKCINGLRRPSAWKKCRKTYNNFYAFCSPELNGLDKIVFKVLAHFLQTYLPTHYLHDTFQRKEYHGLYFLYLFFFVQIRGEA
jgi:hypothetical protein